MSRYPDPGAPVRFGLTLSGLLVLAALTTLAPAPAARAEGSGEQGQPRRRRRRSGRGRKGTTAS